MYEAREFDETFYHLLNQTMSKNCFPYVSCITHLLL